MCIAKVSIAFHKAGFRVGGRKDGNFVATKGSVSYVYSMDGDELFYERLVGEEVDLVGNGVDEILEAIGDE